MPKKQQTDFRTWIGWNRHPSFEDQPKWLGGLIGFGLLCIALCIAIAALALIGWFLKTLLAPADPAQAPEAIRNLGLAAAAVIGLPFLVWRSIVAQRQADTAEQGLITDRINKAVEGLGAVREVKGDGVSSTEPNLEVRIGAIKSLERIAEDSERDRATVIDLLSYYIRGNIKRNNPTLPCENEAYEVKTDFCRTQRRIPDEDCLIAIHTAQKLKHRDEPLNLQTAAIVALDLRYKDLSRSNFTGSALLYSNFAFASMNNCRFKGSGLDMTHFYCATLRQCEFLGSFCKGTKFKGTDLSGTLFFHVLFDEHTGFEGAIVTGTAFYETSLKNVQGLDQQQLNGCFADAKVKLPPHFNRPDHWPKQPLAPEVFHTQWRAWQRTIGFQPDENQQ